MAIRSTPGTRKRDPRGDAPSLVPANARIVSDWDSLNGDDAIIVVDQTGIFSGWIDALTEDRSIMWVQLDNACGRKLFMQVDGCEVWRVTSKT